MLDACSKSFLFSFVGAKEVEKKWKVANMKISKRHHSKSFREQRTIAEKYTIRKKIIEETRREKIIEKKENRSEKREEKRKKREEGEEGTKRADRRDQGGNREKHR